MAVNKIVNEIMDVKITQNEDSTYVAEVYVKTSVQEDLLVIKEKFTNIQDLQMVTVKINNFVASSM